ncbi:MAG TPA: BON domain-containing protein [Vicinamibacterales bacterium]|jgi:hyperosmotically inducible protein
MRALVRALVLLLVLVVVGFVLLNYSPSWRAQPAIHPGESPIGTTGAVDVERARERGAEIGEKAAVATKKVGDAVEDAALTTKIKAKMALDDSVKARAIDVTTSGTTVTLSGTVRSAAEHDRAVALARETDGVTRVIDQLHVK